MLLGVYHPEFFLVTTPSYTFNARFTSPDAPKSARRGYPDPTGRTDRIFRHSDHKFEWTREEFTTWCEETAKEWGYSVQQTSIGRALEQDLWERDEELQGATFVAVFRRLGDMDNSERERRGRALIQSLGLDGTPHEALAIHRHLAHPAAMNPQSLEDIATKVKSKMEEYREGFMRVEELWFEQEIAVMCGGWIEMLVRAVEECPELVLRNEVDGVKRGRNMWSVELIGGIDDLTNLRPGERDRSVNYIPEDWTPGEGPYDSIDELSDINESTGIEGDISAGTSENEADDQSDSEVTGWTSAGSGKQTGKRKLKGSPESFWPDQARGWGEAGSGWHSAKSSTGGWDGDEDESSDTTS